MSNLSLTEQMDAYDAIKTRFKLNTAQGLTLGQLACFDSIILNAYIGNWGAVELALTVFQIISAPTHDEPMKG